MTAQTGLIVSRFVHYAALALLFGAAVFPIYSLPKQAPRPVWLMERLRRLSIVAALIGLVSGVAWLAFTVASMSDSVADAMTSSAIWAVIHDVSFGRIWAARLALGLIVLVIASLRRPGPALPLAAGLWLVSIAATGHALLPDGPLGMAHVGLDVLHLTGAGLWLGGLAPLAWTMAEARRTVGSQNGRDAAALLARFSGIGYVAVGLLVGSGVINSYLLVGSIQALISTPYGCLLMLKVALFLAMAMAAAANRFWVTPALERAAPDDSTVWLRRIGRHIAFEQALGFSVLLVVSILGLMDPSGGA